MAQAAEVSGSIDVFPQLLVFVLALQLWSQAELVVVAGNSVMELEYSDD